MPGIFLALLGITNFWICLGLIDAQFFTVAHILGMTANFLLSAFLLYSAYKNRAWKVKINAWMIIMMVLILAQIMVPMLKFKSGTFDELFGRDDIVSANVSFKTLGGAGGEITGATLDKLIDKLGDVHFRNFGKTYAQGEQKEVSIMLKLEGKDTGEHISIFSEGESFTGLLTIRGENRHY